MAKFAEVAITTQRLRELIGLPDTVEIIDIKQYYGLQEIGIEIIGDGVPLSDYMEGAAIQRIQIDEFNK